MNADSEAAAMPRPDSEQSSRGSNASFGRRAVGLIIDWVLGAVAWPAICFGLWLFVIPHVYTRTVFYGLMAAVVVVPAAVLFVYEWTGSAYGGTVGQRAVGVRLVSARTSGNPVFDSGSFAP